MQVLVDQATLDQALCDAQHIGAIDGKGPERAKQDIPPAIVRFVWKRDDSVCQTPGCRSARGVEIHHICLRSQGGTHDPANLTLRCGACHRAHHLGLLEITGVAPDQIITRRVNDPATVANSVAPAQPDTTPMNAPAAAAGVISPEELITTRQDDPTIGAACVGADVNSPARMKPPVAVVGARPARGPAPNAKWTAVVTRTDAIAALVKMGWKRSIAAPAVDEALREVPTTMSAAELIRAALLRCPRPRPS